MVSRVRGGAARAAALPLPLQRTAVGGTIQWPLERSVLAPYPWSAASARTAPRGCAGSAPPPPGGAEGGAAVGPAPAARRAAGDGRRAALTTQPARVRQHPAGLETTPHGRRSVRVVKHCTAGPPARAVAYSRRSTDQQGHSIERQPRP